MGRPCAGCGALNRDDSNFCEDCGRPLQLEAGLGGEDRASDRPKSTSHYTLGLIASQKGDEDTAVQEFRSALNDELSFEEEVGVRWFLALGLWLLAEKRVSPKQLLTDLSWKEAIEHADIAVTLDRERNCGFFAQTINRAMLQKLDIIYCIIGNQIEEANDTPAAIAFCEENLDKLNYLDPNPLLGVRFQLGVRYLNLKQIGKAQDCFIAIARSETVAPNDEGGWEAGVRRRARETAAAALKEKKCFIATAAYGSEDCMEVQVLRRFRDDYLLKTSPGKFFVSLYCNLSPTIAVIIEQSETLRHICRKVLRLWVCLLARRYASAKREARSA